VKPRVIIYMPFYSGSLEPRHARMHDLIHYLNTRDDLPFEYKVFAEKGKNKDSGRVYYGSIPLFTQYTKTYKNIRPKRGGQQKAKDAFAPSQKQSRIDGTAEDLDLSIKTENFDQQERQGGSLVLKAGRILFRKCKQGVKKGGRFARRSHRRLTNYTDPQYMTRRVCVFMLLARCRTAGRVDVFHIVRPNRVSLLAERILRKRNPRLRVVVGPNIMSYGDLSETYDPDYFRQDHIETVIAVGSYHCELLKRFGVPEGKLVRLPPNVDPSVFYPKQNGSKAERNGRMRILFAASQLAVEKGTHTFLEAIRLFKEEDVDFTAIIAGDEEVISGVQTPFVRSLLNGLENHIQMLGRVSRDRMPELYRQADVFVHAGQPEAGPTTTIEALSCGTPCILPDHLSFKEPELMPGCLFFRPGESQALKECLTQFYGDWADGKRSRCSPPPIDPNAAVNYITQLYLDPP
jgi:glycosyltransferase involved in cell wall biosynthesis